MFVGLIVPWADEIFTGAFGSSMGSVSRRTYLWMDGAHYMGIGFFLTILEQFMKFLIW